MSDVFPLELVRLSLSFLPRVNQLKLCTLSRDIHHLMLFDPLFVKETFCNEFSQRTDLNWEGLLDLIAQESFHRFHRGYVDEEVDSLVLWAASHGYERVIELALFYELRRVSSASVDDVSKRQAELSSWISAPMIHNLVLEACKTSSSAHILPILHKHVPQYLKQLDSVKTPNGYSAIQVAAFFENTGAFIWLHEHGATMQREHRYGQTPFHIACTRNCVPIARYCLEVVKVNPEDPDLDGFTPLNLVNYRYDLIRSSPMLDLLRRHGVNC